MTATNLTNLTNDTTIMNTSSITILAALLSTGALQAGTPVTGGGTVPPPINTAPACPTPISYTDIGASWIHGFGDADGADGIGIDGEFQLVPNFYFRGTGSWLSGDDDGDLWSATVGAGYSFELCPSAHLVLEAGGAYENLDLRGGENVDDFGYYLFPHLRAKLACLEIRAGAQYLDVGDYHAWAAVVNLYYEVAPHVDIAVGGAFGSDSQALQVGLRYRF